MVVVAAARDCVGRRRDGWAKPVRRHLQIVSILCLRSDFSWYLLVVTSKVAMVRQRRLWLTSYCRRFGEYRLLARRVMESRWSHEKKGSRVVKAMTNWGIWYTV
ncbi:hypothetical protein SESBI_50281 [Sesbania bispinosa]|nr:hypothetical protein SESBI_50281 [Sesbania bispinosa]